MEIIAAPYLLPMTRKTPMLLQGALVCDRGKILDIGSFADLKKQYPDAEISEFSNAVILPGLVNAHCHLDLLSYQEHIFAERDIGELPLEFVENLMGSIDYREEMTNEKALIDMQRGASRLIETGVTCLGNCTQFEGAIKLLAEMGLRGIVYSEILAGRGEAAQEKFEVALALTEKYADASDEHMRVGLAPYAPYLLSRHLLKIISKQARDLSLPIQIHAAESFAEMEFFFDSQGAIATDLFPALGWRELPPAQRKTPIQYLADIGFFEAPVTIVGGLQLSASDFPILARHLARIVYCPHLNQMMKNGILPLGKLVESGIPIGLGTGIWNTRLGFSLWNEMRLALKRGSQPLPTPEDVLRMATIGGARALGLDHLIGTLEKGKKSDYIVIRLSKKIEDENNIMRSLVEETEPQHILRVVCGEEILKTS